MCVFAVGFGSEFQRSFVFFLPNSETAERRWFGFGVLSEFARDPYGASLQKLLLTAQLRHVRIETNPYTHAFVLLEVVAM